MSNNVEIKVPDIGDFSDVDVIEVLVGAGDAVAVDDALITLESDKASMDIPAPQAGTILEMRIAVGDKASAGTPICVHVTEVPDVRDLDLNVIAHADFSRSQPGRSSQDQIAHIRQDERQVADEARGVGAVDHAVVVGDRERLDQAIDYLAVDPHQALL